MTLSQPSSPDWPQTLREAASAAAAGDRADAERLFRKVLVATPDNIEALMGLGAVLAEPARKAECFRQVLRLQSEHAEAKRVLARLGAPIDEPAAPALICSFHPKKETLLRCSQCDRPICPRCAQPHVVGHLCKICVAGRRSRMRTPKVGNFAAAGSATAAAAAVIGVLGGPLLCWNWFLSLFAGPALGSLLARVALWGGRGRSGRAMQGVVGTAIVAGSLFGAGWLRAGLFQAEQPMSFIFGSGAFVLYLILAVSSAVAWLR